MHTHLIGMLAILLYLGTASVLVIRLVRRDPVMLWSRASTLAMGFGAAALHAAALYPLLITTSGLNLGFFNAAALVALIAVLILMAACAWRPLESLGVVLLPLAALSLALTFAFPSQHSLSAASWQLDLHILLSILAYSILTVAALQSILLAIQDYQLHNRRPGGLVRALPPLQAMERLLLQLLGVGFSLLTLALLTGVLFLEDIFAQHLVHKTVLSIIAWLVFAVLLWGRRQYGWRGRTIIRWTLGGFVFLMLAYFGSKLVLELLLAPVAGA